MELLIGVITSFITLIVSIIVLTVKGTKLLGGIESRLSNVEEKIENVHDGCNVPRDAMQKVEKKIALLEAKNNLVEKDLVGIRATLNSVEVMTKKIHDHFLTEGLRFGRRKDD